MSIVHPGEIADRYADQTAMLALREWHDDDEDDLTGDSQYSSYLDSLGVDTAALDALEQAEQQARLFPTTGPVSLFECRGLRSCHTLLPEPGICRNCQHLAHDAEADAARDQQP